MLHRELFSCWCRTIGAIQLVRRHILKVFRKIKCAIDLLVPGESQGWTHRDVLAMAAKVRSLSHDCSRMSVSDPLYLEHPPGPRCAYGCFNTCPLPAWEFSTPVTLSDRAAADVYLRLQTESTQAASSQLSSGSAWSGKRHFFHGGFSAGSLGSPAPGPTLTPWQTHQAQLEDLSAALITSHSTVVSMMIT